MHKTRMLQVSHLSISGQFFSATVRFVESTAEQNMMSSSPGAFICLISEPKESPNDHVGLHEYPRADASLRFLTGRPLSV
jgi:hypothetical protein